MEREYLVNGLYDEQVMDYFDSMIESAVVLGANMNTAEEELIDALDFEMKLANVSRDFLWLDFMSFSSTILFFINRFHFHAKSFVMQLHSTIHAQSDIYKKNIHIWIGWTI